MFRPTRKAAELSGSIKLSHETSKSKIFRTCICLKKSVLRFSAFVLMKVGTTFGHFFCCLVITGKIFILKEKNLSI